MTKNIVPVILCGGDGVRLWPASGAAQPKPFIPLFGGRSSFQETMLRVANRDHFDQPIILLNEKHISLARRQLREIGQQATIVVEPARRDTAAAIALGASIVAQSDAEAVIAFMAADHVVKQVELFVSDCLSASEAARDGWIVTFGVTAEKPTSSYGYIHAGLSLPGEMEAYAIDQFYEKPDAALAEEFVAKGYLWNSGNFVAKASVMKHEIATHAPDIGEVIDQAVAGIVQEENILRLAAMPFGSARMISIDHAVMETTPNAAVLRAHFDWSDIGTWDSLFDIGDGDAENNVSHGNVVLQNSKNCYAHSDGPLIAVKGLEDACVVASGNSVLVTSRQEAGDLKSLVQQFDLTAHAGNTFYRPWGHYETITSGSSYQIKRIVVEPGGRLSDQMHHHRHEHWVCVSGKGIVTIDFEEKVFLPNESVFIPVGVRHRIYNPSPEPLEFVEVQYGAILSEDDIVRFDDDYGRSKDTREAIAS